MRKIILYYNTIKYLKPVQIYGRIFSALKNYFPLKLPAPPSNLEPSLVKRTGFIFHDPWNNRADIEINKFCFLNQPADFGAKINWKPDAGLLWQFNLHYFNYLYLLSAEGQIRICKEWIAGNAAREKPGWHPYPLSLRITSWCKADLKDEQILKSLYGQAAFLYRNLEYYHPANHYLENARALIFAGLYFGNQGEAGKWLEKGLKIIGTELPRQILPDGGHYEKSIMYHSLVLELVLDLLNILPENSGVYPLLRKNSVKMLEFLFSLTHPEGNISLFNDSAEEIAPPAKTLSEYGGRLGIDPAEYEHAGQACTRIYPDSGFYIFKNEDIYLAADGGSIGPDFMPAHAHADIFSYELSVMGKKIAADSGVYEYKEGKLREYSRSTRAHNTLAIDGKSQAELWSSFRAARRYSPEDVGIEETDGGIIFRGTFKGYSKLIGDDLVHRRNIVYDTGDALLLIQDFLEGKGEHRAESFIHLHPDVKIIEEGKDFIFQREETKIKFIIKEGEFKIADGLYFPEFGKMENNKTIILSTGKIPSVLSYCFQIIKNR